MKGKFRVTVWDPILLISQILTIQALFYTSLAIFVFIVDFLFADTPSITHIFAYHVISFQSGHNVFIILCFLVNAVCGSFYLWWFVGRAKPCLDFSITCYLIHLAISWIFNGYFPNTFSWWILSIISGVLMCVVGEYLCMKTEMADIPLLSSGGSDV